MARARTKVGARAKKADVRRSAVRPARTKATAVKAGSSRARRQHKFVASRLAPDAFKADGLRTYAHYRDLGVKDATRGMALAHVIRFVGKCDPKVVSKKHTHECEFQMIYVLKGTIRTEIEGHGEHTMNAGDSWLQPQGIVHKVLDYSDGCEVLEIVLPAEFKTVELEK
jgi:mannose-6-phosphate isomerase-like protein (cupin superfamily)